MNHPASQDERQQRLERVIAEFLQALDGDEPVEPQQWIDRHADLNPELAQFISDQADLNELVDPIRAQRMPSAAPKAQIDTDTLTGRQQETSVVHSADTTEPPDQPEPNAEAIARLANRRVGDYEIVEEIGRGGMGVVYEARQLSLNRLVALKMLRLGMLSTQVDVLRFRNEAEAAAGLDHPAIVPVYEVGQHQDHFYFSMKLLRGGNLSQRNGECREQPETAARILIQLAEAVDHAHQRGVLHRDLKPGNVLMDEEGQPYITDFGLARRMESDSALTVTGAVVGSPSYMAPEQAMGTSSAVTTAADVYGLGSILYTLLTGKPPFQGDSVLSTLQQVRTQTVVSPSKINKRVPKDLEVICLKCLEKDPAGRYRSALELADDLQRFVDGRPIHARPTPVGQQAMLWCRRNPVVAALAGVTAILVVCLAALSTAGYFREAALRRDAEDANTRYRESGRKLEAALVEVKQKQAATEAAR